MAENLRKELKRPDQFVTTGQQWLRWAIEHQRTLMQIGGGVVVVLAAVGGYMSYQQANLRQANAELADALSVLQAERWQEAAEQLQGVAGRWSGSAVAPIARIYAAQADLEAGNLDAARATFEQVSGDTRLPRYLRQQAAYGLATIAERSGDTAAALERFVEAIDIGGPYSGPAILVAARGYAQAGEAETAADLFRRFLDEFPDSPERSSVENELSAL